jgi:NAD(P)-dependent dehydrogenase (short-subunit alcohol dehydrogenase family)
MRPGLCLPSSIARSFRQSSRRLESSLWRQVQLTGGSHDALRVVACRDLKLPWQSLRHYSPDRASDTEAAKRPYEASPEDVTIDVALKPAKDAPSSRCRNQGVILTGGTGGIGLAVAKRLVQEGAGRVVLVSRSAGRAKEAVQKIKQQTSLNDAPLSVLLADLGSSVNIMEKLLDRFPWCNTLINCAGTTQNETILKTALEESRRIMETNFISPSKLSRAFLKHYVSSRKRRDSVSEADRPAASDENTAQSYCLVNVSSLLAYKGFIGTADYAAAKAALIAHTRVLALEGGRYGSMPGGRSPFRANVVVPGYIETPMVESFSKEMRTGLENNIPLRRFGSPEEVADAIIFLITNEYANNCVLNLDGGLSAT